MAEMDIVPYIGTRTPADFDTLFDELEAARGTSASLSDAIGEKADAASTLAGYGITDAYTKTETDTSLASKQGELSQSQLAAVNSGITAAKLTADETALAEVVDAGAKNLLNCNLGILIAANTNFSWASNTASLNGVTFTINNDNTISVVTDANGATSTTIFYLTIDAQKSAYNDCVLSGCPSGGGSDTYELRTATPVKSDYGNGAEITSNSQTNVVAIVRAGVIISTAIVFRPMICTKAAWAVSHQFEPYALHNPTLTPAAIKAVDEGAKNLLQFDAIGGGTSTGSGTSYTTNGVTATINSDLTITITRNESSSNVAQFQLYSNNAKVYVDHLCDGHHILSGCPSGGGYSSYYIKAERSSYVMVDTGNSVLLENTTASSIYIDLVVSTSFTGTATFKPMICKAADWAVSQKFVPYCPSLYELYQMIIALQNGTRSASALAKAETEETEPETREEEEMR